MLIPINKESVVPLYEQIKDLIQMNIKKRVWKAGSKIPSESAMVKEFEVSRGTIKKAIKELVDEGILLQKQGLGTFVTNDDVAVTLTDGLHSFYEHMKAQNIDFETKIIRKEIRPCNKEIASKLNIPETSHYLYLERTRTIDGEVIMLIKNHINLNVAPNIEEESFLDDSLFNIIERNSIHKIAYSETRFLAISSDQETSPIFDIELGSPLLFQEQVVHTENNEIAELGNVWLKSSKFYIGTVIKRSY